MNLLFVIYSLLYSCIHLQGVASHRANTLTFKRALKLSHSSYFGYRNSAGVRTPPKTESRSGT